MTRDALSDLLTNVGVPTPFVLAVSVVLLIVRQCYDFWRQGREMRLKDMEHSAKLVKDLSSEIDASLRQVVIAKLEEEEFRTATGLRVTAKAKRQRLMDFVQRHQNEVDWLDLKRSVEFWNLKAGTLKAPANRVLVSFYTMFGIIGVLCLALAPFIFIFGLFEAWRTNQWGQYFGVMVLGAEFFALFFIVFHNCILPLVCRGRVLDALKAGESPQSE